MSEGENKDKKKYARSVAEKRTIAGYPPEDTFKNVQYYKEQTGNGCSYLVTLALQQFFRRNPQFVHPDNK